MKTTIITTNDTGNGNMIEIAMLIPKDIPIHINWLRRNPLLLIPILHISPPIHLMLN